MSAAAPARLLIVDDEAAQLTALCDILAQEGYLTRGFSAGRDAIAALRAEPYDALLTDLMMPQIDGITLLRACREIDHDLACIVMTGHATVATAVDALKAGAHDYVMKPFNVSHILTVLARALGTRRLRLENMQLRETVSIYEHSRAISQGLGREEIIERTLAAAVALTDAAAVYLLTPTASGGKTLRIEAAAGPAAVPLDLAAPAENLVAEWLERVCTELEELAPGGRADAVYLHPFDTAIGAALPIITAGRFFGVLGFTSSRPIGRINVGQIKALDVLSRTAATAFVSAALIAELREMNEALEQRVQARTRELELANKDLESFSYSVSHDLRQPLGVVEGFCDAFRTEFGAQVPAEGLQLLEQIGSGVSRMNKLINDLLHFSRLGRGPLDSVRVPLRTLVLQLVERLKDPLADRALTVHVMDMPDCFGDPALLEQVLVNLLSNAFKFTAPRDAAQVDVGALRQGSETVYYVRDNGVGFDMHYADKLFGVFQRLHTTQEFEGTGIGLSIVHRIVTRHGGRIWADSRKGVGTTFYFTLPAPPDQGTPAATAPPIGADITPEQLLMNP